MMRHWAWKMRELVPAPWRHRIRGRRRVGSVAGTPSAGVIECGIGSCSSLEVRWGVGCGGGGGGGGGGDGHEKDRETEDEEWAMDGQVPVLGSDQHCHVSERVLHIRRRPLDPDDRMSVAPTCSSPRTYFRLLDSKRP